MVASFEFLSTVKNTARTAGGYVEANEGGADAFSSHEDDDGHVDYFDFTERMIVEPTQNGCILGYNMQLGDCTSAEIKVRSSFMRVDPERERDFVAMPYDDRRQGEFGFFRVERPTYDRRRGVTWSGVINLATIHDLWRDSRDDDGRPRPYAERRLRPLVYHLSAGFPAALRDTADQIALDWDVTFKRTASFLRGQSVEQLVDLPDVPALHARVDEPERVPLGAQDALRDRDGGLARLALHPRRDRAAEDEPGLAVGRRRHFGE
jgi:hypothetical protein